MEHVDTNDDDAIDAYMERNPIPEGYMIRDNAAEDFTKALSELTSKRFKSTHRPIVPKKKRSRKKKRGGYR